MASRVARPLSYFYLWLGAVLGNLWVCAPLHAAHPLITEDASTQGRGNFQAELTNEQFTIEELVFLIAGLIYSPHPNIDLDVGYKIVNADTVRANALLTGFALRW